MEKKLQKEYNCVVAEGAGSPVELNLMSKDLSNIYIAAQFNTKIILVADIQRGGVFASIYGVYNLLPKKLRKNIMGVIVNKFQGDMTLFDEGVEKGDLHDQDFFSAFGLFMGYLGGMVFLFGEKILPEPLEWYKESISQNIYNALKTR